MSDLSDLEAIARQTLGIAPLNEAAALADELRKRTAERDAWHEHYKQAERQIADLIAERDALNLREIAAPVPAFTTLEHAFERACAERDALQARVDVLGEFCRNTPQMREVIGELRKALMSPLGECQSRVRDLLRRIDLESEQQPTKGDK